MQVDLSLKHDWAKKNGPTRLQIMRHEEKFYFSAFMVIGSIILGSIIIISAIVAEGVKHGKTKNESKVSSNAGQ